jgi:hypothetical protein
MRKPHLRRLSSNVSSGVLNDRERVNLVEGGESTSAGFLCKQGEADREHTNKEVGVANFCSRHSFGKKLSDPTSCS